MSQNHSDRRYFLKAAAFAGSGLMLNACGTKGAANNQNNQNISKDEPAKKDEKEVTPIEDLMREHGVLRRALLVFGESAAVLQTNAAKVSPDALLKAAKLLRGFGEYYHEKKLEEQYIFPLIKQK